MPLGGSADAYETSQTLRQSVVGNCNAQRLNRAALFRQKCPASHLRERPAVALCPGYFRFHCFAQAQTPLITPRQPGIAHTQIVKAHIAGQAAIARTSMHIPVSPHRQHVPAVIIAGLHEPAVRCELGGFHGSIRQIDTAPHLLRLAQPASVFAAIETKSRKRFGDNTAGWRQEDRFVFVLAKTLTTGHRLSFL